MSVKFVGVCAHNAWHTPSIKMDVSCTPLKKDTFYNRISGKNLFKKYCYIIAIGIEFQMKNNLKNQVKWFLL